MDGTLVLVGGREWTDGCDFDAELLAATPSGRVTIVPTAAAYARGHTVARAEEWFARLGAQVEIVDVWNRRDARDPANAAAVDAADLVYLAGGSPLHLRSVVAETPFLDAIVRVLDRPATLALAGESTSVFCRFMADPRGGAFTVGLDVIDAFSVLGGHNHWSDDTLTRTVRLAPKALIVAGIDDRTALISQTGGGWRTAGAGVVTVYRDGHRIDPDELPASIH